MIRFLTGLLALFALPAHAQQNSSAEVYRVTERGGGLGAWIDQSVAFYTVDGQWIAERTREYSNRCGTRSADGSCQATKTKTRDWIEGASCPKLAEALRALSIIPLPSFADPDAFQFSSVSDISLLTVEGWPHAAGPIADRPWQQHLSISEYTGPFRAWWTKTEEAVKPCWSPNAPSGS